MKSADIHNVRDSAHDNGTCVHPDDSCPALSPSPSRDPEEANNVATSNYALGVQVIADWHDYEKWHDPSMFPIPPFSGAQEEELRRLITEALDAKDSRSAPSQEAFAALRDAAEANLAWSVAEDLSLGSFQARMELCSYSQWLTRKALGELSDYQGVPRLLLDPASMSVELARCNVDSCKALVREALEVAAQRKQSALADGGEK